MLGAIRNLVVLALIGLAGWKTSRFGYESAPYAVVGKEGFKIFLSRIKRQVAYIHFHNNRRLAISSVLFTCPLSAGFESSLTLMTHVTKLQKLISSLLEPMATLTPIFQ